MAKRKFTLRRNGCLMTTVRIEYHLTRDSMLDLIARYRRMFGEPADIGEVLSSCLQSGVERLQLDSSLDNDPE